MIIISDSRKYTEHILAISPDWSEFSSAGLNPTIIDLIKELFDDKKLFITKDESALFSYAFIAEHSAVSQFKVLTEYFRNREGIKEGILCLAGSGDNFKGFRDRAWISLPGNVHLSAYLNPDCKVDHFNVGFSILAANAVVQTIDNIEEMRSRAAIKWVNDILIEKAKVSGVLCKTQTQNDKITGVFLGIGINVLTVPGNVADLTVPAADCLKSFLKNKDRCTEAGVLNKLLFRIEENYREVLRGNWNSQLNFYRERSAVIGKKVTVYSDPVAGKSTKVTEGVVSSIGENLELYLENLDEPLIRGRILID